jgi:cytoskeletal protein RodZ
MRIQQSTASILSLTVAFALWFPQASWAQNSGTSDPASPAPLAPVQSNSQEKASSGHQTTANPQVNGTTVNPSQPPLQPVTTYPDAAGNPQKQMDAETQTQPNGQAQAPQTEPQGAATAEKVPAAGGAAAKPAGAAIAPAKQRQVRSLFIKLGAVAAGAVAAGTIYGLSRGTPSTPPGSTSPAAVQKR